MPVNQLAGIFICIVNKVVNGKQVIVNQWKPLKPKTTPLVTVALLFVSQTVVCKTNRLFNDLSLLEPSKEGFLKPGYV